jgi:phosphocarrier protein FPr/phosphocarrier protein
MNQKDDSPGTAAKAAVPRESAAAGAPREIVGVCAVPGVAVGPAFHLRTGDQQISETGAGPAFESALLADALGRVAASLSIAAKDPDSLQGTMANAHRALLEDEELAATARQIIDQGKSAAFAWRAAIRTYSERLGATGDPLLKERVDDLLDLERQVISAILGDEAADTVEIPPGAILLADNVLPSQWMKLDKSRLAGLCTAGGGPTSHVAIMAAACGMPTIVAAGGAIGDIPEGSTLLLDASAGRLVIEPDTSARDAAAQAMTAFSARRERERAEALAEGATADGRRIHILANLGSAAEAGEAVALGAEGCGLLRTEFLFLDRTDPPTEDEQLAAYQQIADALDGRPLIVRTLDVGGDKPLPYLPIPHEENPALGLRGVRVNLWRPDLLDEQLRAILRVRPAGRCRIMVPMIVSVDELLAIRSRLNAVDAEIGGDGRTELGVMIETPAAALLADQLADEADFFSIGSNDLTQYALAMDRGNPLVAAQVDALHPAVLRLIAATVGGAAPRARPVGVCGAMASDTAGALLLVGLGVSELSVAPAAIAAVKSRLREVTVEQCRAVAAQALEVRSAAAVRTLVAEKLGTTP